MGLVRELLDRLAHRGDRYRCDHVVELVTEYLDGAMSHSDAADFERHLRGCPDCERYIEQMRRTVDTLGWSHPTPPDPATRRALMRAFRDAQGDAPPR